MDTLQRSLLSQLDKAIELYNEVDEFADAVRSEIPSAEDHLSYVATQYCLVAEAAIERATGSGSLYLHQARQFTRLPDSPYDLVNPVFGYELNLSRLLAVLKVVREAVVEGYLDSTRELVHAEVFSDFLEMAEHLQETGYKDPANVIAGTVLEEHLRKLAIKYDVPIETTDATGKTYPKKAEVLNTELAGKQVYGKNEQKQVTAWLGLRNSAAHGHYDQYSHKEVALLIQGIRGFLARYPA